MARIARDLEDLRQVNHALFARAMPWLDRIELMPDPRGEATAFDTRGVLHLDGPLKRTAGAITRAFPTGYDVAREERYRAIDPTAVPPRERRAYFEHLIRSRVKGSATGLRIMQRTSRVSKSVESDFPAR